MVAIHQHLRLDDWHQTRFLRERSKAGERMCVDVEAVGRRTVLGDIDHGAPLGEAGALLAVDLEPFAHPVQSLGHLFVR